LAYFRLIVKISLWITSFWLVWWAVGTPVAFINSAPIEVKIVTLSRTVVKRSGYGGRGGYSYPKLNVQFEYRLKDSPATIGHCFSTAGEDGEWADYRDTVELIEKSRGQSFIGQRSRSNDSVCLFVQVSWKKVALAIYGSFICIVISCSYLLAPKTRKPVAWKAAIDRRS
jgi:hypothetical protein